LYSFRKKINQANSKWAKRGIFKELRWKKRGIQKECEECGKTIDFRSTLCRKCAKG